MGPEGAKSFPGRRLVAVAAEPGARARQEIDYGRRGRGYVFGAFQPATGAAFTAPYLGRTTANWVDFLERVDPWLPAEAAPVYAIVDNLSTHSAPDVLLFSLAHPRWEFVFQPTYAAYLNLFETWDEVCQAVREATRYWNAHRHPFIWGQRRRHRPRRRPGVGLLPKAA